MMSLTAFSAVRCTSGSYRVRGGLLLSSLPTLSLSLLLSLPLFLSLHLFPSRRPVTVPLSMRLAQSCIECAEISSFDPVLKNTNSNNNNDASFYKKSLNVYFLCSRIFLKWEVFNVIFLFPSGRSRVCESSAKKCGYLQTNAARITHGRLKFS